MSKRTWAELVAAGRQAVSDHNWTLGDLAAEVETSYGEHDLERYARAIDVEPGTLKVYRYVAAQWPVVNRFTDVSWTVHMVLAAQDDRFDLIESIQTVSAARTLVKERGQQHGRLGGAGDGEPDFSPTDEDEQTRLDQVTCPECGHRFRPGEEVAT